MVKDTKGRYPGQQVCGAMAGAGRGLIAADRTKTTSTDYRTNCLGCHVPVKASDWVYVGGYPPLHK